MSSYRQILYHIIFSTYKFKPVINLENKEELCKYICGIIKNKKCVLYRINAMKDHIHILSDLHPSIALADFIKDIKTSTSVWIKKSENLKNFEGWADGYAALTYSYRDKEMISNYILNQEEHHKKVSFIDEYKKLLSDNNIIIDEKYFP